MEDRPIIIAIKAVLKKIACGERYLLRPELERNVAGCGMKDAGGGGLGFEVVEGRHLYGEGRAWRRPAS